MKTEAQRRPRSKAERILILVVMVAGTAALISGCASISKEGPAISSKVALQIPTIAQWQQMEERG